MTVGRCWPGRPRPLPDEIFSSWFARVAGANGLTAAELYGTLFPRALKRLSSDLDYVAPVDVVGALVAGTGLDEATVRSTTLAAWAGKIFDPEDVTFGLHWLPPIGNDLSRQTFGQQFCPLCLAEDDVLVFRRRWRLKFVVACEVHGVFLADRCQGCSKPIHPIKLVRTRKRFECPSCGHNLARQEVQQARDINYQQRLLAIAEDGHIDHPGMERMASVDWFNLLRSTVRLLSTRSAAAKLRRVVATADERLASLLELPPGFNVDTVTAKERHQLLLAAMWLLESWPHRFFAVSRAAGVPQMQLDNIWPYRVGNSTFQAINRKTAIVSPD